jgi:ribokinase
MAKITVVGSSNVDLLMKMSRLPELGETITDGEFVQVYGGKGANQAVGAARAGAAVTFVNAVGDDAYTERMVANYEDDGIDTSHIFHETGIASGHALIMIGEAGNNYLAVAPGANYCLTPERVDEARAAIEGADMLVLQNEIPVESTERAMQIAHTAGVPILFNYAPASTFPRRQLDYRPILVVNETEARSVTGREVTDRASAEKVAPQLVEMGCRMAIITLGAGGSVAATADGLHFQPAFPVEAVDTTAAGDVFCGSLAVALSEGQVLPAALRFASAAAALAVTVLGAQPSAPTREAIEELLATP